MAFVTIEDLYGSVEVLVFPRDYEKRRDLLEQDAKVFITGKASIGDDPVGKLICEQVIPFEAVPRELWLQYPDKEAYFSREQELLDLLRGYEGNDQVIIYLGKEKAKKCFQETGTWRQRKSFWMLSGENWGKECEGPREDN